MTILKPVVRAGLLAALLGTTMLTAACQDDGTYRHRSSYGYNDARAGSDQHRSWRAEDQYWRETYESRPYYRKGVKYETYRPAYRYGEAAYDHYEGRDYKDIKESELRAGWERFKGKSKLKWSQAKAAVRDSYERTRERADRMDGVDEYTPEHRRNRY